MQRKPGFPIANCNIKVPDGNQIIDETSYLSCDDDSEQQKKRQQLINFGHSQWGFNNWSWSVSKQDLDFVDYANGKYSAGVVAFVSVTVKNLDIHRENIGYATSVASMKGSAIYKSRKGAVTNALRETLLSFGGSVATELTDLLLTNKPEVHNPTASNPEPLIPQENNQNLANKPVSEPKNLPKPLRKEEVVPIRSPQQINANPVVKIPPRKAPLPANLPPANKPFPANQPPRPQPPPPRPNSNEQKAAQSLEGMTEEEARAERKRRQRQAQEEFRLKQIIKNTSDTDKTAHQELHKSSFDNLLMDIPTQDIVIEETAPEEGKRCSPESAISSAAKRRGAISKLDIVTENNYN